MGMEWKRIAAAAEELKRLDPWSAGQKTVIVEDGETDWHIWFFSWEGKNVIGCYPGEEAFRQAFRGISSPNRRKEPVFHLQDGVIGMWDDRKALSARERACWKQADVSFHGNGNWLFFRRYRRGYLPGAPTAEEIKALAAVLEGACGILRGERESDLPRQRISHVQTYLVAKESPRFATVRYLPMSERELCMDLAYADKVMRVNGKKIYPQILAGMCNGNVLRACLIDPDTHYAKACMTVLQEFFITYGRPRTVVLANEKLISVMEDLLRKMEISLRVVSALPEMDGYFAKVSGGIQPYREEDISDTDEENE